MIYREIRVQAKGSSPEAHLTTYLLNTPEDLWIEKRPMVIVCPGGAYAYTSRREAEPVALAFNSFGYHAAVLDYSCAPAHFPTALEELASVVRLVREHADEWHVDRERILVQGCSAGGHLAASLGILWQEEFLKEDLGLERSEVIRPNGMILAYPVITGGEYAHRDSFRNLLGEREPELRDAMSLEKRVTEQTCPAFVWATFTDGSVPAENSLLLVSALKAKGVSTEFHLYPHGGHGLSLANDLSAGLSGKEIQKDAASWTDLARTWLEANYPLTHR